MDASKRIDYARRLERIESLKAKKRMSDGGKGKENFPNLKGQTRDVIASKLGIGSGKQYEKEKYIVENQESIIPHKWRKISVSKSGNVIFFNRSYKIYEWLYHGFTELNNRH